MFCNVTAEPWEFHLTDVINEHWVHIMQYGHPQGDKWYHFEPTYQHTLQFTNDANNTIQTMAMGMDPILDFWINDYLQSSSSPINISIFWMTFITLLFT